MAKKRLKEILDDLEAAHILRNRLDMLMVGTSLVSSAISSESMVLGTSRAVVTKNEILAHKRFFEREFGRVESAANRCCDLMDLLFEEAFDELETGFPEPTRRVKGLVATGRSGNAPTPKDLLGES